jgi:hypothetical protein
MRFGLALFALMVLAAAPVSAQPVDTAQVGRELTEGGQWAERLGEALTLGADGLGRLNQSFQALVGAPLNKARAAAAVPNLRKGIERSRADVQRSNAMLDSLPPLRPETALEMSAGQLLADARAHNVRILSLLDAFEAFVVAMGKADMPGMQRTLPRMLEGSFAMLSQQRLLVRNRQAAVPRTDSSHQSLGVAAQLYRAMEAVFRRSNAAQTGSPAEAAAAAAAAGEELRAVAADTRALAVEGRRNLQREMAEIEVVRRGKDAAEARLAERIGRVLAAEAKTFELADRLVAYAEANRATTPAQLRTAGAGSAVAPLTKLELEYASINQEQAAALAGGE